jgi:hypothetical protein
MHRGQFLSSSTLACGVVLISVFGCVYGFWQYSSYSDGKYANWIDRGTPESAFNDLHLFDASFHEQGVEIYVRDDANQIFLSHHNDSTSWVEVEEAPSLRNYYSVEECSNEIFTMASQSPSYPDQEIADCKRYVWNWETIPDDTYAIMTEEGFIYTWHYSPSLGRLIRYSISGMGIGFLLSILILIVQRFRD